MQESCKTSHVKFFSKYGEMQEHLNVDMKIHKIYMNNKTLKRKLHEKFSENINENFSENFNEKFKMKK